MMWISAVLDGDDTGSFARRGQYIIVSYGTTPGAINYDAATVRIEIHQEKSAMSRYQVDAV
eukprot:6175955-Pleurochrysis_carterae.AAC.7